MALTEKDLKEFAHYMGIDTEKAESLEKAKEQIGAEFIRKSMLKDSKEMNDAIGARMGSIEVAVKRLARENGVELPSDLISGKKVEEVITIAENKLKETYAQKITDLQKQIEDKDSSKIIGEWQEKYTKLEATKKDLENMTITLKTELDTTKQNSLKAINEFKIADINKRALDSIPYSKEVTDIAKTGFRAILSEKYALDLDENGNPYIKDKQTNSRIPNPTKMGEFMTPEDVYKMEAEKNNLLTKVDANQKSNTFVKKIPAGSEQKEQVTFNNPRRTTFRDRSGA